ncbi:hypothetical protein RHECNPAF_430041 [Rhizobium etli CNPAF512]|nr:hypothetical protein RHECNPAF_430041 [Rhizobium etli CNPAF512]
MPLLTIRQPVITKQKLKYNQHLKYIYLPFDKILILS